MYKPLHVLSNKQTNHRITKMAYEWHNRYRLIFTLILNYNQKEGKLIVHLLDKFQVSCLFVEYNL